MDILEVISQTIDSINELHIKFSTNFYSLDSIKERNLRSLKRVYVSKAQSSDFFMNEFLPAYYSALENSDIEDYYLLTLSNLPSNVKYRYRIKLRDTTIKKLAHYAHKEKIDNSYPLNKCLNDILGTRLILNGVNDQKTKIEELLDGKKADNKIKRYYYRDKDGYKSFQCYFQMNNKVLPWELQIWDIEDEYNNTHAHIQHERERNII